MKKIDWFLLIFLLILIILTPIIILNPDFAQVFDINQWFGADYYDTMNYWLAIGVLIIVSIIGAIIPIPVPYIIPASVFASVWWESPEPLTLRLIKIIGMIFIAAFGNALGDFIDYLIGDGAGHVMSKDQPEITDKWGKRILKYPKAVPWIIVIFGTTPFPDSLLLVPLGLAKYPIKKTLLYMYIGKVIMFTLVAIAGMAAIEPILDLLGEGGGDSGSIIGIILLFAIWLMIALMAKWDTIFKKKDPAEELPDEEPPQELNQ